MLTGVTTTAAAGWSRISGPPGAVIGGAMRHDLRERFTVEFVPPLRPTIAFVSSEEFQIWTLAAGFYDVVELVGFSRVFPFAARDEVNLPPTGMVSSEMTSHTEQN
jgi:hypothetical protein